MHGTTLRLATYAVLMAGLITFGVCTDATHAEALYTPDDTHAAIHQAAEEFGVSELLLTRIVDCETGGRFDPYAVGRQGELGAAQLHPRGELPRFFSWGYSDPFSPYQAVRFLAQEITYGRASQWTCA